jgi:hypothetical protein
MGENKRAVGLVVTALSLMVVAGGIGQGTATAGLQKGANASGGPKGASLGKGVAGVAVEDGVQARSVTITSGRSLTLKTQSAGEEALHRCA